MARLPGPGRDFDDQWNASRREGEKKAARGEGPWAHDKAMERLSSTGHTPQPQEGGRHAKPNSDSCLIPLGLLGGLAWALSELAGKVLL